MAFGAGPISRGPISSAPISAGVTLPAGGAPTVYVSSWQQPLAEPVRLRVLAAAQQQALAFVKGVPFPETVYPDKWFEALSEPVRFKPRLLSALQAFGFWNTYTPPSSGGGGSGGGGSYVGPRKPTRNVFASTPMWNRQLARIVPSPRQQLPQNVTASPYTFTAPTAGNLVVTGGTVSSIKLTRAYVSAVTFSVTSGTFPLAAGDVITLAYTVAPTVNFVPTYSGEAS
jgi:hypothetical protein